MRRRSRARRRARGGRCARPRPAGRGGRAALPARSFARSCRQDSHSERNAPIVCALIGAFRSERGGGDVMRAVLLSEFGPPENLALVEVPDPAPGPGQVLVDVEIANVTFVETQIRAGRPPNPAMTPKLPVILGNGVGGIVSSVGDGVDPALVGRRVVT